MCIRDSCGGDIKGLYAACMQLEALCLKPARDAKHPEVHFVVMQGYWYLVKPEMKLCKGSQQAFCVQNRIACPCDDEVPATCTVCGFQKCRNQRQTVHRLELVPFLPYPEVRVEGSMRREAGGKAEALDVPCYLQLCSNALTRVSTRFRTLHACYGLTLSYGWDFPSCCGANIVGTLACCLGVDCVFLKPVDDHRRVRYMISQGHLYVQTPSAASVCRGQAQVFCLELRYSYPPQPKADGPCACACWGAQCVRGWEFERACCVTVEPLPRVKPAVNEASDVLYHDTRASKRESSAAPAPATEEMERL